MFLKKIVGGLLLISLLFPSTPALALVIQKIEPTTISPLDLKFSTTSSSLLFPILPQEDEPEPDRVLATSTVIVDDSETETIQSDLPKIIIQDAVIDRSDEPVEEKNEEPASTVETNILPPTSNTDTSLINESSGKTELITTEKSEGIKDIGIVSDDVKKIEAIDEGIKAVAEIDFSNVDVGASLDVCNIGPSCTGDVGRTHWSSEAGVNSDGMRLGLRFAVNQSEITNGILQASYYSFVENENPTIIYSKGILTGESIFDFSVLSQSETGQTNLDKEIANKLSEIAPSIKPIVSANSVGVGIWEKIIQGIKNIFSAPFKWAKNLIWKTDVELVENKQERIHDIVLKHDTYYLRVVPTRNGQVAGKASNEIKVVLSEPSEDVVLYSPAKIYEVKIKDFQPIRGPQPGICTGAVILDTDWIRPKPGGGVEVLKVGERVCPATFQGVGEEAWYESLWNTVKSGVDWVSEAYNSLKSAVVDGLASVACGGDETCRMAISAGLDIGLAAMGVPPSLPNFDELVDGGFDYLASEIASQAGCPDAVCKQAIKDNLKKVLDENKNTNPGCKGAEEAHRMGIEPLCLPDNVKSHLDPLATYRNSSVVLEVERNYLDGGGLAGIPYKLYFNNIGYNAGPVGSSIVNIEPYGESVQITEPLQGQMFQSKMIVIPDMEKGETVEIPIVFTPEEYWVPGHKEAMHGWSTVVFKDGWPQYQYDDWWKLYYGGTLIMGAVIDGCESSYGDSNCIISSDNLSVSLPNGLNQ